jgi:hypothetical protein
MSKETSSKVFHVGAAKQQQAPLTRKERESGHPSKAAAAKADAKSKTEAKAERKRLTTSGEARRWPLREMVSLYSYYDSF